MREGRGGGGRMPEGDSMTLFAKQGITNTTRGPTEPYLR